MVDTRFIRGGFFVVTMLLAALSAFGQTIISAADYGVKANSFENAAVPLQKAIEACQRNGNAVVLSLPGGRIDVWPENAPKRELYISNCTEDDTLSKVKNIAFLLEHCNNITIEGNNTLVILHGKMISFALLHSSNIRIHNISFDYERPTMSELTVRSVSSNSIETTIHPDSKFAIDSGRITFYGEGWKSKAFHTILLDIASNTMHYSSIKPLLAAKAVQTAPLTVYFEGNFEKKPYKPDDVLTIRDPYRDNCGGFISQSRNVELYHVNMYYMHGLGIVSQFSENVSLEKVSVAPRENNGRVIASFADCFHFSGCKGLIRIDSCFTSGSHDDPVNVHGTHLQITAIDASKKMTVRFMHHQTYGFEAFFAGDSIAFINPQTLLSLGSAKLKSATLINHREMELELEGDLPAYAKSGVCIENLSWTPQVIISNSRFERTNTRGLLITTRRKVIIENNTFYHTGMFPILIADDATSWFESGAVKDVLIRNNVFDGCGYNSGSGAINIAPENHEWVAGGFVHRNIRITGNTFITPINSVLQARSVDGLEFSDNKIQFPTDMKQLGTLVLLTGCRNVKVMKNQTNFSGQPTITLSHMTPKDLATDWKPEVKD